MITGKAGNLSDEAGNFSKDGNALAYLSHLLVMMKNV
jgi:hypothetical protein